jgi:uncharacterized repeat protein (TIGR01451 family)
VDITSDKDTAFAGDVVTFQATVRNVGTTVLSGSLLVSVIMDDSTFESVTSSDPALACARRTGARDS